MSDQWCAEYSGMILSRNRISPHLVIYESVGAVGETVVAKFSEDVDIRCHSCGTLMGNVTARSENQNNFDKIVWMNKNRIRCRNCDDSTTVRPRRSENKNT